MTQDLQNKICEVDLIYSHRVKANDRPKITDAETAYKLFRENWDDCKINLIEQFKIMLLDRKNAVIGISTISSGGTAATVVDAKIIFAIALKGKANALIIAHNHPSGNIHPSQADISITKKLVNGGKLLDINIFDHLIITDESYSSMNEQGLIP